MNRLLKKEDSIVSREIAGEVILVPIIQSIGDVDSIYTLNELGAQIWNLIDGKISTEKIKEIIINEYDIQMEQLDKDVDSFISDLIQINAVSW